MILFPIGIPNIKSTVDNAIKQDNCAIGLSGMIISQLNHSFLIDKFSYRAEDDLIIDTARPECGN